MGNDTFYQEMQDVATDILTEFGQGTILLETETEVPDPLRPWSPGAPVVVSYRLDGAMRLVDKRFVDGTLVVGTESQATVAVTAHSTLDESEVSLEDLDPQMGWTLVADGSRRVIKKVVRIPEVGTAVAYALIVDG